MGMNELPVDEHTYLVPRYKINTFATNKSISCKGLIKTVSLLQQIRFKMGTVEILNLEY